MRGFVVADLNVRGELQLKQAYQYEHLEQIPGAAELIGSLSAAIWRSPEGFELSLSPSVLLRWSATAPAAGIATVRVEGELTSLSVLASGRDPQADAATLQAFQRHLLAELRDIGYEPAFDLLHLPERPLVATTNFRDPADPTDRVFVAIGDRCFAAAYFRFLGLA